RACRRMPRRPEEAECPRGCRSQAGRRDRYRHRLDRCLQGAVQHRRPELPHAQAHHRAGRHRALAQPRRPSCHHLHHRRRDRRICLELRRANRAQGRRRRCRDPGRFALVEEPRRQDRRAALRRPVEGYERPQHVRASSPRRPRRDVTPRCFPPPGRGVTSICYRFRSRSKAMSEISHAVPSSKPEAHAYSAGALFRSVVIALTAFLTLVDLFATQAILPMLTEHYGVTPGQMGLASNASTLGMLVSGLAVGYFSSNHGLRAGILISLVLLSIPTALLAYAPNLTAFAILRILQGLCMASAFTLTLAYLGEHYSAQDSASAFAAYITGNVASNLIGRLISAGVADLSGLAAFFFFFALLNLAGALLVYFTVEKPPPMRSVGEGMGSHFSAWIMHP